ncbi:hypothetical protein GCM10012275_44660 [Longimycelium tulufanense]|uniref:GPP34 family phosphoprotein n=2 Tax=Longimycelium tulufanense TaxID=907463 RepID=A0A8J3FXL6_9PSEU|nr:hypothetical protein GCM10012275_44660 [Longimycelium tulufanense]
MLLSYDREGGRPLVNPLINTTERDYCLVAAALFELAMAGRLKYENKKLVVVDDTPVGDPDLDKILRKIARSRRARSVDWWLQNFYSPRMYKRLLHRLVGRGILRPEKQRKFGLPWSTRYIEQDPRPEHEIRDRLERVVVHRGPPDERTATLAGLVHTAKLDKKLFPQMENRDLRNRMKEIREQSWAGQEAYKASVYTALSLAAMAAVAGGAAVATSS